MPKSLAMVLERPNQPLVATQLPIPKLEDGQVLAKITASGVCGSDVHMWQGNDPRTPYPIILGHEGVGEIADIAGRKDAVGGQSLKVGDKILWNRGVVCGACYWCTQAAQPELCPGRWAYGIHRSVAEPTYLNGCYGQYIVLDARTDIFLLDNGRFDPASIVPVSCSGATAAHAMELCRPRPGDVVLVQGPGPLGAFVVAFARDMGAASVVVVGGSPQRLQLCQKLGATHLLNRKETSLDERAAAVLDLTHGRGADLVIEAVGLPSAHTEGLRLVRRGGKYVSVGVGAPAGNVGLDLYRDLVHKNLHLQGVWVSHTRHTDMALRLVQANPRPFAALVTHRFCLEDATKALEAVRDKEGLKVVLTPDISAS